MSYGRRQLNLRSEMALWAVVLATTLTLALTAISAITITQHIERESHDDVATLANDVAQAFDHRMAQNYRMVEMAVGLDLLRDRWASPYQKSALLANLQITFPDCRWIGLTDRDGIVKSTGDGRRENSDVHDETWFIQGSRQPMVSSLHQPSDMALALQPLGEFERIIDVARPVRDLRGNVMGVLNASISWKWALDFRDMLLRHRNINAGIDILVTDGSGRILIGPGALIDQTIGLTSAAAPTPAAHGAATANLISAATAPDNVFDARAGLANDLRLQVTSWPDGGDYISAVGTGAGYQDFPGLGWNIVVRQPRAIALALAGAMRARLIEGGITLAVIFAAIGWLVSGRITGSISRLTALARRVDRGERGLVFPIAGVSREVAILGETLDHLVGNLLQREQQLLDLNTTLEQRIDERTAMLATSNRQLEDEMAQRQAMEAEREALIRQLRDQAERDPLTGALNRRAFLAMAERDRRRLRRDDGRIAIIMFDIDHFKRVNDTYGHATGDEVIRKMAATARAVVREGDLLCRYGGEEFALLLADPGADSAALVAERLRCEVAALTFKAAISKLAGKPHAIDLIADHENPDGDFPDREKEPFQVTVSLGVTLAAARDLPEEGVATLLDRADQALYGAKRDGRNRTMIDQQVISEFARDKIQLDPTDYARSFPHDFTAPQVANDG